MKNHTNHRTTAAAILCATLITATTTACGPGTTDAGAKAPTVSGSPSQPEDAFAGLTADQISDKAADAVKSARSLRMITDGPDDAGRTVRTDMYMDRAGSCRGKVIHPDAGTMEMIKNGAVVYLKGDEKFWRAALKQEKSKLSTQKADAVIAVVQGRWMKADQRTAQSMTRKDICELDKVGTSFDGESATGNRRGADITRDGKPYAVVYSREGNRVTTVHIAKTGKPYPVELSTTGSGTADGHVRLSDFDKPVDITPPPADQVLDTAKLR